MLWTTNLSLPQLQRNALVGNYSGYATVADSIFCRVAEVVGPDHIQIALRFAHFLQPLLKRLDSFENVTI